MDNCIFCKIRDKQIPAKLFYEDDEVMAFPDAHPAKPVHILVVPKEHIPELFLLQNKELFQKIMTVVQNMIAREGLKDKGYRITINGGGAQDVNHLHIHVMGPIRNASAL